MYCSPRSWAASSRRTDLNAFTCLDPGHGETPARQRLRPVAGRTGFCGHYPPPKSTRLRGPLGDGESSRRQRSHARRLRESRPPRGLTPGNSRQRGSTPLCRMIASPQRDLGPEVVTLLCPATPPNPTPTARAPLISVAICYYV